MIRLKKSSNKSKMKLLNKLNIEIKLKKYIP